MDECSKKAENILLSFEQIYQQEWLTMMRQKLGLLGAEETDAQLIHDLLAWMHKHKSDFTNTFIDLSQAEKPVGKNYDKTAFSDWYARYAIRRLEHNQSLDHSISSMQKVNPQVIPRNHLVEQALADGSSGNLETMYALLAALQTPYNYDQKDEKFLSPPPPSSKAYQTFCGT